MRLEVDNLLQCDEILQPSSEFYQKPEQFGIHKYAFYVCPHK